MNTRGMHAPVKAKRALPMVASTAAVLFALTACGSNSSAEDPATEGTPASPSSATEATPAPPALPEALAESVWTKRATKALGAGIPALVPSDESSAFALTNARFVAKPQPTWRLTLTNADGATAQVEQTLNSADDLVSSALGDAVAKGEQVNLTKFGTGIWDTYPSSASTSMSLQLKDGSALVTAPTLDQATAIAQTLLTYEADPGGGEG